MPYNSLRPIRDRKGLTIAQLAGKTSISIRTLQSYEAGERTIAPDDLRKLSRVLFATPTELLQPSPPPPSAPPPPTPAQPVTVSAALPVEIATATVAPPPAPTVAPAAPVEVPPRRPFFPRSREQLRSPEDGGNTPPRQRPVRPPREPRPPRPPGPSTAGQLDQIRHLARRLGLDDAELVERAGAPLESLDHAGARAAIARLRKELEDSGTWQPRVGEGPDHEGEYLRDLRDRDVPIDVQLITGERISGVVEDFTAYVIRLRQSDGADVSVRKLAIAYYQTRGPVDDSE